MACTSVELIKVCRTHKRYIASGAAGGSYHGERCKGCAWWEDSPADQAFWKRLERLGVKR